MSSGPGVLSVHQRSAPPGAGAPASWPYLLVHGSMDRATSFRRLQARLGEATIITYDRRGYAGSLGREVSEVFADQVADLIEVLDGRPVVALGHSFGGGVVLAAAQAHPELIRAAVIWEPPMPWLATWPAATAGSAVVVDGADPGDVAESFMRRMVGSRIWDRLPAATRQARREEGPALVAEIRSLRRSPTWDPTAVAIPVIVGSGEESRDHQRQAAGELAGAIPDAELVVVAGAAHGAHLSHPAELADLLRRAAQRAGPAVAMGTMPARGAESGMTGTDEERPS